MIVNVVVKGLAKTLLLLFSEVNRFSRWTVQNPVYAKAGGSTDRPTRLQKFRILWTRGLDHISFTARRLVARGSYRLQNYQIMPLVSFTAEIFF